MQIGSIGGNETTKQAATAAPQPRLVRAAHEFEGLMMKELLQPMTASSGLTGDESDSDSGAGSGGALSGFASEMLGQALSRQGGFGIADSIVHSLSHTGKAHGNGTAQANQPAHSGIRLAE